MKKFMKLFLTGFCMGMADIVPGVSGGTMAFILGVYQELIITIRRLTSPHLWKLVFSKKFSLASKYSNWWFLASLLLGILCAVITLSHVLEQALQQYPVYVWSFFFGLVLSSIFIVAQRISTINIGVIIWMIFGAGIAYKIVGMVPTKTPDDPLFLVLSGAIAICAMILPGISGSFLLVILGKYEFILRAITTRDIESLLYFSAGAGGGILAFSHVLSWVLHRYYDFTIAFLSGLMIGSLQKIWPWKVNDINVLPELGDAWVWQLGVILLGCFAVILLEKLAEVDE